MVMPQQNSNRIATTEVRTSPAPRIAREAPPVRDSLLAILARRMSFARYRSSPRYARHRSISPRHTLNSVPLLADTLTIYLADSLPTWAVARLGPSGIIRAGRAIESTVKAVARVGKILTQPLRGTLRSIRRLRAWKDARRHRRHIEAAYMSPPPRDSALRVLLDSRIMIEGFHADSCRARLWMRSIKPVAETCQVFVHLYPEQPETLPAERRIHGYLCKDHYPAIEIKNWRADKCFRDDINFEDVLPGYYRIEAGLIDVATFRKFPVDGSARTSVDLGWVRIGSGGPA